MDIESSYAVKMLETIGKCNAMLVELGRDLRKNEKVRSVERHTDCDTFPVTGTTLDLYLDVELRDGYCLSFSVIVEWDGDDWLTIARISLIDKQGSKVIQEFPERKTETFSEVLMNMVNATSDLIDASGIVNEV